MTSRFVAPRARRMALMVASVPEFTNLTFSHDGKKDRMDFASCVSFSVGAPNVVPFIMVL